MLITLQGNSAWCWLHSGFILWTFTQGFYECLFDIHVHLRVSSFILTNGEIGEMMKISSIFKVKCCELFMIWLNSVHISGFLLAGFCWWCQVLYLGVLQGMWYNLIKMNQGLTHLEEERLYSIFTHCRETSSHTNNKVHKSTLCYICTHIVSFSFPQKTIRLHPLIVVSLLYI